MKYWAMLQMLMQDRRGIAAVEYAVLVGVVAVAIFTAFNTFDFESVITGLFADLTAVMEGGGEGDT